MRRCRFRFSMERKAPSGPGPDIREASPSSSTGIKSGVAYTTYADVGGAGRCRADLARDRGASPQAPRSAAPPGRAPHRGVLLYDPPGCGKTLLARAVAHESGARFFPVSGPELITKWHGESKENLRKLFAEAQQQHPFLLNVDWRG